jgi:asparagine N-glycosylation enzyme membrane subunit Stt3
VAAPTPSYAWSSTASGTTTAADTLTNLGFTAGDLLVVSQHGTAAGSATPVAPTLNGSSSGFTDGPASGGGGADSYANAGTNNGRAQIWSKILVSGDLSFTLNVSATGFTVHRFSIWRIPGNWASDRIAQQVASTANTGSTAQSLTDPTANAIVFSSVGYSTAVVNATLTWDGATSGSKFQRSPYVDGAHTTSTTTSGAHGSHYSSADNRCYTDYQEYASSDTLTSVLWNNGMGNTSHAVVYVVYKTSFVIALGTVSEVDTAQPITVRRTRAIGTATETDTAQAIARTFQHILGTPPKRTPRRRSAARKPKRSAPRPKPTRRCSTRAPGRSAPSPKPIPRRRSSRSKPGATKCR